MSLQKHLRIWFSIILVTGMVCFAELMKEPEIIFPEAAAIVLGTWVMKKQPWHVERPTILILLILASVTGWLISAFVPLWIYFRLLIGLTVSGIMLLIARSTFFPVISAAVLPILTESKSVWYPVSVLILGVIIVLGQYFMERLHLRTPVSFSPCRRQPPQVIEYWLSVFITIAVIGIIACGSGLSFLIAPPLIVTFCEMMQPVSKARSKPFTVFLLIAVCACAGSCIRLLFCSLLHFPLALAALIIAVCLFYLMPLFQMTFPPAAAIALLPVLIDEKFLFYYPFEVMAGSVFLIVVSLLMNLRSSSS